MTQILHGLRVADLSIITAGAGSTAVLADFGADVIKIEGPDRPDSARDGITSAQRAAHGVSDAPLESPPLRGNFTTVNRNKRAIAVDLRKPEGLEIIRRLIAVSDVVVENFHRGALERLGLGFDELIKMQPKIVLVTISSQGANGPNVSYGSYGFILDGLAGVAALTGYDNAMPVWSSGVNFPDQIVSMFAPGLIVAGILAARESGIPKWIDLSQREALTSIIGEWLLHESITGVEATRAGNQGPEGLEWVSSCAGDDEWVAISLVKASHWQGLSKVLGDPGLPSKLGPEHGEQHASNSVAVKELVSAWTQKRSKAEAAELLQAAGVPAAPVKKSYEAHDDPYLKSIGFFQAVDIPPDRSELERGFLTRFDDPGEAVVRIRAPFVGEHTTEVLTGLLGYSAEEVMQFMKDRIVSGN